MRDVLSIPPPPHLLSPLCRGLENELVTLIGKGQIQARIDSVGQIMYARTANQRTVTFQAALQAGEPLSFVPQDSSRGLTFLGMFKQTAQMQEEQTWEVEKTMALLPCLQRVLKGLKTKYSRRLLATSKEGHVIRAV
jgi:hypothetical protein